VVTQAHDRCLSVHPWTVDQPGDMAMLVDLGVDGMFTNVPTNSTRSWAGVRCAPGRLGQGVEAPREVPSPPLTAPRTWLNYRA